MDDVGQREIAWALRAKQAPEHSKANGHGTSWVAEVIARFITSLRTTPPTAAMSRQGGSRFL
jgi:hypothetical protein